MDELSAITAMHKKQRLIRKQATAIFLIIIALSSVVFVVYPKVVSGMLMQLLMLLSMLSVFGLVFLDRTSFVINRKMYKKDILHNYLFEHSEPEDIRKDSDLVLELIASRRKMAQDLKRSRSTLK